ncbi:DeoR/GlpR family DNA-binding transcription regulator [Alkalicoccus daliensis]|uniref:Transcriptional regulator, DeoR family n=1 Tax=Alkalicoccus daliensis TaxID=745820 RepID=A0A1H0HBU7_9BACI|nr:DeoR/GlpR family DNA-binding transcription regulator [Alkalicoccus daliensis]SDO16635.1 transcriptional regulator, DeoR family [Alkalicoccus daliensis]
MLAIERKKFIKDLIIEKKSVTVAALTNQFKVTEETIRRDLKQLEEEGVLTRTYGGAYISEGVQNDVDINLREHIHVEGKKKIAKECLKHIHSGDSIFLDASTTSLMIAQLLKDIKLTVVTNSIKVVQALNDNPSVNVVVIGGQFSRSSQSNLGRLSEKTLEYYYFDIAFISCRSVSMEHGITDSNELQAGIRRIAADHGNTVFLVADYTKFDKTSFIHISEFDQIQHIVVDGQLSEEWKEFLRVKNIFLHQADTPSPR